MNSWLQPASASVTGNPPPVALRAAVSAAVDGDASVLDVPAAKGLEGGLLLAPSWLVVLLGLLAVAAAVSFFLVRWRMKQRHQLERSVAPQSSRR